MDSIRAKLNTPFLKLLYHPETNDLLRYHMVICSNKAQFKPFLEIVQNLFYGNIPISASDLQSLKPYASIFKALVRRKSVVYSQQTLGEHVALLGEIINVTRHWIENNIFNQQAVNNEKTNDFAYGKISKNNGTATTDSSGYGNLFNSKSREHDRGPINQITHTDRESDIGQKTDYSNNTQQQQQLHTHSDESVKFDVASALSRDLVAQ